MNWELIKFLVQAAISVGGAFLAAYLATKRFRTEKWWERKAAAYGELVDALHRMKRPSSEHMEAATKEREIQKEESEREREQFKVARRNVLRIADSSSFLISKEVLKAVQQMEHDLGKASSGQSWLEHLEDEYSSIDKCLASVKELGRIELGVKDTSVAYSLNSSIQNRTVFHCHKLGFAQWATRPSSSPRRIARLSPYCSIL